MPKAEAPEFQFGPWTAGLVNAVSEYSLPSDALSVAEDVDIDREGIATTRKLWALQDAGRYVSVFKHEDITYAVSGAAPRVLGVVGTSSFTAIENVAGPVAWTTLHNEPVYTDGEVVRVISGGQGAALPSGYYEEDEGDEYQLVPLPGGSDIHYWQGRLLLARGNSFIWSEALRYGVYSATQSYVRFPEKVHWLAPLPTGVYVGTRSTVYFLSGSDPAKFTIRAVGGASAPGASAVYSPAHADAAGEYVALWFTSHGIAIGRQSGTVKYPQAERLKDLPLHPGKMVVEDDRVTIFTTKEH